MLLVLGNLKVLRDENAITKVCGKDGRRLQGLQAEEPVRTLETITACDAEGLKYSSVSGTEKGKMEISAFEERREKSA